MATHRVVLALAGPAAGRATARPRRGAGPPRAHRGERGPGRLSRRRAAPGHAARLADALQAKMIRRSRSSPPVRAPVAHRGGRDPADGQRDHPGHRAAALRAARAPADHRQPAARELVAARFRRGFAGRSRRSTRSCNSPARCSATFFPETSRRSTDRHRRVLPPVRVRQRRHLRRARLDERHIGFFVADGRARGPRR